LIAGLILFPALLFAQFNNNNSSPYSRYGVGDLEPYSFGRSAAMGGATLGSRYALQLNSANPASYTAIDSLNFLFEFGMHGDFTSYKSDISSGKSNDINFNYFIMGFRLTDWAAASIGMIPYSNLGYNVTTIGEVDNSGVYQTSYFGEGTISDAKLGLAIKPFKYLSVGANLNYRFGNLKSSSELLFASSDNYLLQRYLNFRIADFGLEFGAQAMLPMTDNRQIVLGVVFENKAGYNGAISDIVQKNIVYGSSSSLDTLYFRDEEKGKIEFPKTYGIGLSYAKKDVYEINVDFYHQQWSEATFFGSTDEYLTDLNKFAVGGEWTPERNSIRNAYKRLSYRAGFNYEECYYIFDGHQIKSFGITFGLGIPLYRSSSSINVSAELGKRGTTKYNLVLENYAKVNLSANLHDLWFIQRKID